MLPQSIYSPALTMCKFKSPSWYRPWIATAQLLKGRVRWARVSSRVRRPCFPSLASSLPKAHKFPMPCSQLWRSYALSTTNGSTSMMRHGIRLC